MWCQIITVFPEMFDACLRYGVMARAIQNGHLKLDAIDLRDFAQNKHATIDDRTYGGGPGMVFKPEPLSRAIQAAKAKAMGAKVIYATPAGKQFNHRMARDFAKCAQSLIFISGRYEGIDQRIIEKEVDEVVSIGDYVLSGGELPIMVMLDAIARWIPGVLGHEESALHDSFSEENLGLLDCPHYTRPAHFEESAVPEVLLQGDHQAIARWRKKQALGQTWLHRKDLLANLTLDEESLKLLAEFQEESI